MGPGKRGHDGVVSGYSTSTSIPRVDRLSTGWATVFLVRKLEKKKIQLHVLSWLITCCFCMKNGSDCMLFFQAENLEKNSSLHDLDSCLNSM